MNKSELVTEIEGRFNGTVISQGAGNDEFGATTYNWKVKVVNGMSANVLHIPVIVFDDGGAGEDAYYRDGIPVYPVSRDGEVLEATNYWRDLVLAKIADLKTNDQVKTARIDWINEVDRIAKVTGYVENAGSVDEKVYLVYEDKNSTLQSQLVNAA